MFRAGSESWRAGVDDHPRLVHLALYVRDACGLDVPDDPSVPPRLIGEIVDHIGNLTPEICQSAGEQWLSWWQSIITLEGALQLGTLELPGAGVERRKALSGAHESLLDWPELDTFTDRPALRKAVRASYEDARLWQSEHSRETNLARSARGEFGHGIFRPIVESLVERLGVRPGQLRAGVLVIGVEGEWSSLVAPGVLLCSESTVMNPEWFSALVEEAFVSGLEAVELPLPAYELKTRPLPASALPEPLVLWSGPEIELACKRVIPYPDGFELELCRSTGTPPPTARSTKRAAQLGRTSDTWRRADNFAGLEAELHFADGRRVLMTDLGGPDHNGEIVLNRFWREESDENTLWLWVMPLPPRGRVTLAVNWLTYGIEAATVGFEGDLVRPEP